MNVPKVIACVMFVGALAYIAEGGPRIIIGKPKPKDFDVAMHAAWKKKYGGGKNDVFGDAGRLCVSVPLKPAPDARSKSDRPFSWRLDFLSQAPRTPDRDRQLRQLDALSKAGLLRKSVAVDELTSEENGMIRYTVTDKGWRASDYSRGLPCFRYGTRHYQGVSRFETKGTNGSSRKVYEVYARSGLRSVDELPSWSRTFDMQDAFPEIRAQIKGEEVSASLELSGSGWILFSLPVEHKSESWIQKLHNKIVRGVAGFRSKGEPSHEEIKEILKRTHGVGQQYPWPNPCLALPGSERLPVDKELFDYRHHHYAVAIFPSLARTPYDRVIRRTIPYLRMLESLGVVTRRQVDYSNASESAGMPSDAVVYEMSTTYANKVDSVDPSCFPLGDPSIEFVDVQSAQSSQGKPIFRYKLKVQFRNSPAWMKERALLDGWLELRNALKNGIACDGEFEYNAKTRDKGTGAGSCWWAFDSYVEDF